MGPRGSRINLDSCESRAYDAGKCIYPTPAGWRSWPGWWVCWWLVASGLACRRSNHRRLRPRRPPRTSRSWIGRAFIATTMRRGRRGCRWRPSRPTTSPGTPTCGKKSSGSFAPGRCRRLGSGARTRPPTTRSRRYLETTLDGAAGAHPNPGRTAAIRRLTRTEYQNAVRDLLALDVDVTSLLPADDSSYGFDNVTVGGLSPTLLERYISAAEKISRLAVGRPSRSPGGETIRIPPDLTQEEHLEGLPIGTRGGVVVPYTFPRTASTRSRFDCGATATRRSRAWANPTISNCCWIGSACRCSR